MKKNLNRKKINISTKVKIQKHQYTVPQRCFEKITVLKVDQKPRKITEKMLNF